MKTIRECRRALVLLAAMFLASTPLAAQQAQDTGATDGEIRIGNIMPYTGPLAAFAAIGRAEAAYFDMVNDRGGINGRKIRFISRDDSSSPKMAVEHTHQLVEQENVLLMFSSFGTPSNLATRSYLNEKMVPQLFVASGDEEWAIQNAVTMGWQPTFAPRTDLRQLHPGRLSRRKDRCSLAERPPGRDLFRDCRRDGATAQ